MGSFDCPGELAIGNDKILGINTWAKITLKEVEISYGSPKRIFFFIHPLLSPSPALNLSQHQSLFQ